MQTFGLTSAPTPPRRDIEFPHYLCRIPSSEYARGKIALNDRSSGHYCVVANFASRQHQDATAEPNVSSNDDWGRLRGMIWVYTMVIRIVHCCEVADLGIVANFDVIACRNGGPLVNKNPRTDLKVSIRCSSSDFAAGYTAPNYQPSANFDASSTIQDRQASIACYER